MTMQRLGKRKQKRLIKEYQRNRKVLFQESFGITDKKGKPLISPDNNKQVFIRLPTICLQ
jgi:hypothetical protein